MSRTRSELATSVLRDMGVLDASETPSADDATLVKAAYDDKYEEWQDENLVYWQLDEIPNAVFLPIRDLIVNEVKGAFGQPTPSVAEKMAQEEALKMRLRRHVARSATGHRIKAEYF